MRSLINLSLNLMTLIINSQLICDNDDMIRN